MKTATDICHKWIGFWQPRVGYNAPPNIISAMEEYAKIYHESEVNKLSKADVIKSVCHCRKDLDMPNRIYVQNDMYMCKRCGQTVL